MAKPLQGLRERLLEQLAENGRLVIPVGGEERQRLLLISRDENGYNETLLDYVSFVPMLSGTRLACVVVRFAKFC